MARGNCQIDYKILIEHRPGGTLLYEVRLLDGTVIAREVIPSPRAGREREQFVTDLLDEIEAKLWTPTPNQQPTPYGVVEWNHPQLQEISQLELIPDNSEYKIGLVHGKLRSGEAVNVKLPFTRLTRARWKSEVLDHAKEHRVYAKGLNLFNAITERQRAS